MRFAFLLFTATVAGVGSLDMASAAVQRRLEADTGSIVPIPKPARIPDGVHLPDDARARIATADFARCTVDRAPAKVARVLGMAQDETYMRTLHGLVSEDCLYSGHMVLKPMLLRGALFVELYRRRVAAERSSSVRAPEFSKVTFTVDPLMHRSEIAQRNAELLQLANCIIGKDETNAREAILLPTASKGQEAAIVALVPSLSGCIPAGMKLTFSRPVLEGIIAEMLYRGAQTPTVQTAGAK